MHRSRCACRRHYSTVWISGGWSKSDRPHATGPCAGSSNSISTRSRNAPKRPRTSKRSWGPEITHRSRPDRGYGYPLPSEVSRFPSARKTAVSFPTEGRWKKVSPSRDTFRAYLDEIGLQRGRFRIYAHGHELPRTPRCSRFLNFSANVLSAANHPQCSPARSVEASAQ